MSQGFLHSIIVPVYKVGVRWRPGESWSTLMSWLPYTRWGAALRVVCPAHVPGRSPYAHSRGLLTGAPALHRARRGGTPSEQGSTASGMAPTVPGMGAHG
jgi:hypothetical protein